MTKNHRPFSLLAITFFLLVTISCQEDPIQEETEPDEDMIMATKLADEYLLATGREDSERSITVLRFKDGKLYFATSTDDYQGYEEVTETTITASVEAGEYVFWYSGGGVTDLDEIEFDPASQLQLVDAPEEINADKMWKITIPEDIDEDAEFLKYDIIYQYKENNGPPIRLDPKIKIQD